MGIIITRYLWLEGMLKTGLRAIDWLPSLAMRLFLAPVMIAAGAHKFADFESMVEWFGNADWGLGLPLPSVMVFLAAATELFGGLLLLFGLATRWIAIPLSATMLVAILSVHMENGWFAIAPSNPDTSAAKPLAAIGFPGAQGSLENSLEVGERLTRAREILRENGNFDWLSEKGSFVILNNGIEFAVTYLIMLVALMILGGGRIVSVDYWLRRKLIDSGDEP